MQQLKENADRLRIALAIAENADTQEKRMSALKRVKDYASEIQRDAASIVAILAMVEAAP